MPPTSGKKVLRNRASRPVDPTLPALLATKSNYDLVIEGRHLDAGLQFPDAMITSITSKRANQNAAEQARRDTLKDVMVELKNLLCGRDFTIANGYVLLRNGQFAQADPEHYDSNMKSSSGQKLSKVELIRMAVDRIQALEKENAEIQQKLETCLKTTTVNTDEKDQLGTILVGTSGPSLT